MIVDKFGDPIPEEPPAPEYTMEQAWWWVGNDVCCWHYISRQAMDMLARLYAKMQHGLRPGSMALLKCDRVDVGAWCTHERKKSRHV